MTGQSVKVTRTQTLCALGALAALCGSVPAAAEAGADSAAAERGPEIQEVVVTAQKRAERLQDVPVSVSAFDNAAITKLAMTGIQDITRLTPGVDVTTSLGGQQVVSIRGIVWSVGAATTGIYVDDTPIQVRFVGQGVTAGNAFPNLFDLDRVEVLRGPQGTLFGSGSEGGAIRFITPQPSLTSWSGHARAELSFLQNGEPNTQLGVAGGGPLIDGRLAVRASLYSEQNGGWIDRVPFGLPGDTEKNANSSNTQAANLALTWAVTDNFVVTPSVFYQRERDADLGQYWPSLSNPGANRFVNGYVLPQPILDRFVLPALKMSWNLPGVTLYSNTSYMDRTRTLDQDYTYYVTELLSGTSVGPLTRSPTPMLNPQQQFTQELRAQSADASSRVRWVVGAFFQRVDQHADQTIISPGLNDVTGALFGAPVAGVFGVGLLPGGVSYKGFDQTIDKQTAGFGQVDVRLLPGLTLTAGLRYAHVTFNHYNFQNGPFNGGLTSASNGSAENSTTPKLGLEYKAGNTLLYASAAKGYRPGGGNTPIPTSLCAADLNTLGLSQAPPTFGSDHVWSYELGSKGSLGSRRLQWDASAFVIKWSEVQSSLLLPACGFAFITNLGTAESKGFDLQLNAAVTADLTVGASVGYTDSKYTRTVLGPNSTPIVSDGDRLAASPWHATLGIDYDVLTLSNGATLYAHLDGQYSTGYRTANPGDALYDPITNLYRSNFFSLARAGLRRDRWDLSLFAKNLTNSHSVLYDQHWVLTTPLVTEGTYAPRSIGVTGTYRF